MMSASLRRRLSRRKFHHEPADIEGLSTLLSKVPVATDANSDKAVPGSKHGHRRTRSKKRSCRSLSKKRSQKTRSPSPTSVAKAHGNIEDENDLDKITLRLGGITFEMDEMGNWTSSLKGSDVKDLIVKKAKANSRLSHENNLLRVKNELLADMIAKKTLRKDRVVMELEKLRKLLSSSSSRFSISLDGEKPSSNKGKTD